MKIMLTKFIGKIKSCLNRTLFLIQSIISTSKQLIKYFEIYLFSNQNKDNKFEINFIDGAKIILKRKDNETDIYEMVERIRGKYEIFTEPGEVEISVIIKAKEKFKKDLFLNNGLNTLRIEL